MPRRLTPSDAVDQQLARYRSMRDFSITAEPAGKPHSKAPAKLPFCVQKHAASHLHYDFRLGWNGVLKSWTSAKGPSYVTSDKRLAVQVEDHPIEYGGFEGVIPTGQYGGGTVMLWDQGTWEPQPGHADVDAGLRNGSLKFILHGTRLKGMWALIRMGGHATSQKKPNWLLIKEHDEYERVASLPAITDEATTSVVTDRTLEQIAASQDHVWNSNKTSSGKPWAKKSEKQTSKPAPARFDLASLPKEDQPAFIKPQLALEAAQPPAGPGWLNEIKLDGYRMQARKSGTDVRLLTRSGINWTDRMPAIAEEVARLAPEALTLDGEVVVLASDGTSSFAQLQAAFQSGEGHHFTYFCFDLLHLDGHNTRNLPLRQRKSMLAKVLASADQSILSLNEHIESNGIDMLHKACELHAEGIVSKLADAPYKSTRSDAWLKCKCLHEQEFVIGAFTLPSNGSHGIGSLLLGYYENRKLIYAGRTGTGFTHKMSAQLRDQLENLKSSTNSFATITTQARKGAHWVTPTLVAQVRFATWTADQQVRQAAFLGLREDKPATEVYREQATVAPRPKRSTRAATAATQAVTVALQPQVTAKRIPKTVVDLEHAPVRLTHPEKVLDPESKLTKQQLANYYWAVADSMLPYIAGRPLSLVRCPEGSEKPCFFQKHANNMLPPGVESIDVRDKKTGTLEPYITLNTRDALASLAQIGVLEVHPWGSRNANLERPDLITIDLDPHESVPWPVVAEAAKQARKRFATLKLTSFVKTTGGKGLHIVVPIGPDLDWPQVKEWTHRFVLAMERDDPARYITKMTKAARTGKIYLDYLRNERGATAVAPYSPRARTGMNAAMPLSWKELDQTEHPVFRVSDLAQWSTRLRNNPWSDLPTTSQRITPQALKALGISS